MRAFKTVFDLSALFIFGLVFYIISFYPLGLGLFVSVLSGLIGLGIGIWCVKNSDFESRLIFTITAFILVTLKWVIGGAFTQ